ncbi:ABC transporter substrate-binding protein [Salinibacterium sp. TMP30]|uniref:ABC transporter substrate-binding protein n=1 Tax=Salinibacterium sp. TMP30 TaxID=3138237 RepID=UPI0031396C7C
MSMKPRPSTLTAVAAVAAAALFLTGCSATEVGSQDVPASDRPTAALNTDIQAMLPERIMESGVITVGTEAYYPPYESFADDDATIIGLDPDLLHAVGDVLGVEIKLENMAFDGLLPALDAKRLDIVSAALTINADRVEKYDFVTYFNTPQGITVPADNPKGITTRDDLCGLNVAVLDASHQLSLLEAMNDDLCSDNQMTVTAFTSDADALQQLQSGRADASLSQYPVAAYSAANFGNGNIFTAISDPSFGPSLLGEVFRKDDTQLRDAVQAAINDLIDSGVYEEVLDANDLAVGAITQAEINEIP